MLHVFIFHGFKSTANEIAAFDLTPGFASETPPPCRFINSDWDAGAPYLATGNGIQAVYQLVASSAALHAEWDVAIGNMAAVSQQTAAMINQLPGEDALLLVGYSMGTLLIGDMVAQLTRKRDIYLFFMAGSLDRQRAGQLLDNRNVIQAINCLSPRDFMLRKQLPEFMPPPISPVGLHAIDHDKALNAHTGLAHADYLQDPAVLSRYGAFILQILQRHP
ncbi:hypothetical protein F9C28_08310 [Shimwellia pseudoproteus]|uniref:hypothetical protein n=1 Tax=Shimwellia pseudoproteus TaxID=570012 RepID=UPI0018ED273A|nr:hypothetical protein [Shimwellia pseudoproteus]MBJ3814928.1 hypothetical protein [Shimwellia pseudoproteus]